ncbi:hypothetical protein [Streptomyces olivaceoviridis]|uniref:hypothetical protein n=1 Tax=Streptomyces olivaceoviridis TaxID=1921 RepID=UPI0036AAEB03
MTKKTVTEVTELSKNPIADAVAAELHRRWARLDELHQDPERSEAADRRRMQLHGELMGLRAALGIVLGGTVPGGDADRLGMEYHVTWMKREGKA